MTSDPPAPPSSRETERVAALHRLEILDTVPEQAYDDLAVLASQVCGTPIALVAMLDAERQWYKASVGTALRETPINVSFCAHAINAPERLLVVEDALQDPRFADNPFVVGEPNIRFYAGAPIIMSTGNAVGTLCVIDSQPRVLSDAQYQSLMVLARHAAILLDLRAQAIESERVARASEQMTVEARLKQKRGIELLELVLRGGQMGLWDLHVPSGVWTVNAREQMMLGHADVDSATDHGDWRALIHPDDWPALAAAMEPHIQGKATFYECTHRMLHAQGHYIWVLDRGVIVERDVWGNAVRIVGTHVDVTAQRARDEAERRSAERLELALASGEQGLWDWNVLTGAIIRSDAWRRMMGYSLADVRRIDAIGIGFKQGFVFPEDWPRYKTAMDVHLRGLTPMFDIEVRMRRKDGQLVWIHDRGKVVERDEAGSPVRVIGTAMDITARKGSELALVRSNDLLERTGRMAQVGGWAIDLAEGTVVWSDEIYRLHDLDPSTTPDLATAIDFFEPASRKDIEAAIAEARATGAPWDLEVVLTTARGRRVWIRTLGSVEWKDDKPCRIVGTAQDITDRKEAQLRLTESERRLRVVTDSLPALIAHIDADQRYTFVNASVGRIFGIDSQTLVGKSMQEVRVTREEKSSYDAVAGHVQKALSGKRVVFEDFTEVRGRPFHYQTHYAPDLDASGKVIGFYAMTFDITQRKQAEIRRVESEERLRGITDNLPVMIAEIDRKGRFRFVNETYRTWLGVDPQAIVGMHVGDAISREYYAGRREYLQRALRGEEVSFEQPLALDGGMRCLQTSYRPHFDAAGQLAGLYALTSDITELKETQAKLETLARFDPLTGLANRRQFEERLVEAMARTRRTGNPMAVLYLDIDRFKAINDSLGHGIGDAVLVEFAARLQGSVREIDLVARHAGDEFVVLLEGIAGDAEARAVGDKLAAAMRPAFAVQDESIDVTTSVGVAIFDGGTTGATALLSRADKAMYEAKSSGRNCVALAAN